MCSYLKNMEGYKLKDLKLKEFDYIQEMFDRAFKRVNTFKDFRTEFVKGKEKRAGIELIQEITKKTQALAPRAEVLADSPVSTSFDQDALSTIKALEYLMARTRIVEENLHIRFSENTPNVVGSGPGWLFYIDALTRTMNYEPIVADDSNMLALEDDCIFDFSRNDEDDGAVADMNNLDTTNQKNPKRNKNDERGIVIRNKARLVAQGYTQEEGINYDEVFAPVARIEAIRLFLAYASLRFLWCIKMDVKSDFLYEKIEEEGKELCIAFEKLMHEKFQMSSMGELTFFLGLQVKQKKDGIFISQDKYVAKILKKFGFTKVKTASTPMETQKPLLKDEDGEEVDVHIYQVNPKVSHLHAVKRIFRYLKGQPKLGLWYPKDSPFDLVAYTDSDYAGASLDRKSTIGGCQILGCRLISWQCKKQTVLLMTTTEAEYVAASSCCGQIDDGKESLEWNELISGDSKLMLLGIAYTTVEFTTAGLLRVPQPSDPIENVADEAVHKELGRQFGVGLATTASRLETEQDFQETMGDTIAQTRFESVSKHSNDSLLARGNTLQSDEDRLKLDELMAFLEKKNRSRTHRLKRLYKVGLTARVESSDNEESLGEDASKQERIDAIDADKEITIVSVHDVNVSANEEVFVVEQEVAEEVVRVINTAKLIIDAA
ncbi:retrovirus-related pol polyprotein from transposon TNT 1-94 [Tanacetum coccineum]